MDIIDTLYESYTATLEQLELVAGQQIVVALGGGADSQAVLDLTLRYRRSNPQYNYLAIHLDHYFHPDSPKWAAFLADYCRAQHIDAIVEPLAVDLPSRHSKEAQGRSARYQRLAELTSPNAVILLGQHLSDQTETFLLQLKRGAGPKGLAAMARTAAFQQHRRLCRPLLGYSKSAILDYARSRNIPWIEDETNKDTRIDRNFLRHDIIPALRNRWPQFENVVARSATLCAEQQQLLDELLATELQQRVKDGALSLSGWDKLSRVHQAALLRAWLSSNGATMPSHSVLQNILQQITAAQDARVQIRWGHHQLCRYQNALFLLPAAYPTQPYSLEWNGISAIEPGPDNGTIISDPQRSTPVRVEQRAQLWVRNVRAGDKFRTEDKSRSRSLSRSLARIGVAPWQRKIWPVITSHDQIVWVPELGINADYVPEGPLRTIYPIWDNAIGSRASS